MRLFNILLEIVNYISSRGKTLWTGEWSSGTITVPGSSNYGTFMINVGGQWMFANRTDPTGSPTVGGDIAFLSNDTSTIYQNLFRCTVDGDQWTLVSHNQCGHILGSDHIANTTGAGNLVITQIIGMDPLYIGGGYHLAPFGWGWRHEIVQRAHGAYRAHRCRRPVFTGWADTDTVGVCANLNHAIWLKQIWRAIRHVSKIFLGRSRNRAELRHFRRIRILHRNLVTDSNRLQSFHLAQFACKRCKHALDSYWQGLAPERGWAV